MYKRQSYEYRVYVHGALRTHQIYSYPFLSKDNEVERLTGIIIDKTSTRKTEEKLVASENLFNSFFENVPVPEYGAVPPVALTVTVAEPPLQSLSLIHILQ